MPDILGFNFDQINKQVLQDLVKIPDFVCSPRGSKVNETLAMSLELYDPRARLIGNTARNTNYGFAVGEFLWYWSGKRDLETMVYYNKRMGSFTDDGESLNSAYGYRIRKHVIFPDALGSTGSLGYGRGGTQWETVVNTLVKDPESRRAILLINQPEDQRVADVYGSKDVPCTLALQFFIRQNKLILHTTMRSNDVVWGLTYDLFSFTLLQECMLLELKKYRQFENLELGHYYHTAGSMHLYEHHFSLAEKMLEEYGHPEQKLVNVAPTMLPISSLNDLDTLCRDEERLRKGEIEQISVPKYGGALRWMAEQLNQHREKRVAEAPR